MRSVPVRVAHLIRPAAGGMRAHVRILLHAVPGIVAAPADMLESLSDVVPDPPDRYALEISGAYGPAEMLREGINAGCWARRRGATLLHGHGLRLTPLFVAASLASGLPLLVTLHNLVPENLALPIRVLLRSALWRARRIIAVSQAVARSAEAVAPIRGRLTVIPNGVDLDHFAPAAASDRESARKDLGIPRDAPVALCVARLSPEKDVGNFIEAAALLAPLLPQTRFLVAGGGPLLPTLRYQVGILRLEPQLTLLGRQDDIPRLLTASDLLCLPSREEGLPLAALEAMAAGLPVVASAVGGLPEAIEEGVTGRLVPPRAPAALAAALRDLLADSAGARAMGRAGRERAAERFSLPGMIAATRAAYQEATQ